MDGLLIDSEPFWQETERRVFRELGIDITEEMQVATFGLRTDEQVRYWFSHHPWKGPGLQEVEQRFDDIMTDFFHREAEMMPGAREALDFFRLKGLSMALASSSRMALINTFLDKFTLHHYFQVVYSAEFEAYGKPHPAVFIETARRLHTDPGQCLALEDSFHGLIAAKAARMKTIAVPVRYDARFGASDVVLQSLEELDESVFLKLNQV